MTLTTIVSHQALATCDKPVTYLLEGQAAPCNGYLLTPEMELTARTAVSDLKDYKNIIKGQDDEIVIMDKRITLDQEKATILQKELDYARATDFYTKAACFVAGVVIVLAVDYYATKKARP